MTTRKLSRLRIIKTFFFRVFIIISISSIAGIAFNLAYPRGLNPFTIKTSYNTDNLFTFIDLPAAREELDNGEAIFIDTRNKKEFNKAHIPGAINLPVSEFAKGKPKILEFLPEDTELILYCESAECKTALRVARLLKTYNFTELKIIKPGWNAWQEKAYPAEAEEGTKLP